MFSDSLFCVILNFYNIPFVEGKTLSYLSQLGLKSPCHKALGVHLFPVIRKCFYLIQVFLT